ncbi:MAG TPA: hypothetical protein VG456_05535 [Candidatus Sulfopaludibacter sp.]|jgi:hypothetical protein|nr:hypothetical protein [Candidatus Sulfopaludibacter sp.]
MKHGWILGLSLLLLLVVAPHYVDSCSPGPAELRFATYHNPLPEDLAHGRVGVLRPHFRRRYLLLAYRDLSGVPSTLPHEEVRKPEQTLTWLDARKLVAGAPAIEKIDLERKVPGEDYQFYVNCLEDAFTTAAATLQQRAAEWGAASPLTAEWLRGQDQVFQNCSGGPAIPKAWAGGNAKLAADRDYQIAAAEMYAGQYDQARADFDRIAANRQSAWRDTSRYVAARVSIRQATMAKDASQLNDAETRLDAIVNDASAGAWRERAQALLGFVRARTQPRQQLVALGDQLMKPRSSEQLERVLVDYTSIWDHLSPAESAPLNSDVAHWIGVFQSEQPALEIWREKKTMPWLIAALHHAGAGELITAAHSVKPDSPAWDSVTYYGILSQIRAGNLDAARTWTDEAMAVKPSKGTMNLLRSERLRLARDWTEFLQYATRRAVTSSSDEDEFDDPIGDAELKRQPVALDDDSVSALNREVPLALWIDATKSRLMPANLQADLAQAGWVRAVVLGDSAAARSLAQRMQQLKPALAGEMGKYLAEKDAAAARFTATFLMLRAPGMEPVVRAGYPRDTPVMQMDSFRDNWWLLKPPAANPNEPIGNHQALADLYPDGHFGPTEFLPAQQRAAGEIEWQDLLQQAASSVAYLCANAIEWARAHPQDPRVPQALHLAVQATHYGKSDRSSPYSRQAFDLLHQRYPNSEWAKKTKYWY